ncbi:GtrA family protein [uncultured Microbulbifer sp.]|uniref:GtrA family protein n=1 Tax=uncultured Microbulbifer sp. TaxID=348147 RepID=UPI00260A9C90|nr:GtrA family protein [uncultured Microbulbifer sp.]
MLRLIGRFGSFVAVGGFATATQYLALVMLIELAEVAPVWASALAYGCGALVSYLLNFHITFRGRAGHRQALPRFVVVVGVGLGVNTLCFYLVLVVTPYLIAQVVATLVTLFSNYLLHHLWIYREETSPQTY